MNKIEVIRAEQEWQRAGAYSVRIEGMNRQYNISLREEFDEHDCDGTKYIVLLDGGYPVATGFYEKLGYKKEDSSVIKSGNFDCIKMKKQLT